MNMLFTNYITSEKNLPKKFFSCAKYRVYFVSKFSQSVFICMWSITSHCNAHEKGFLMSSTTAKENEYTLRNDLWASHQWLGKKICVGRPRPTRHPAWAKASSIAGRESSVLEHRQTVFLFATKSACFWQFRASAAIVRYTLVLSGRKCGKRETWETCAN